MNKTLRIALFLLLAFAQGASAQFLWRVSHTDQDWRYKYDFRAVSCSGNNCTATAVAYDGVRSVYSNVFLNSSDGGQTWAVQDPGISQFPWWVGQDRRFESVQQIDAHNVVAVGDSGLIARTTDGGLTWQRQYCNSRGWMLAVHFSDPLVGIATVRAGSATSGAAFYTLDGGLNWQRINQLDHLIGLWDCHSYGGGKFRVFSSASHGTLFTTIDNWQTVTESHPPFDTVNDPASKYDYLQRCNFGAGDTLIIFGQSNVVGAPLIRSTDGGSSWGKLVRINIGYPAIMTSIDRDTVFMTQGTLSYNRLLVSTDRGITWHDDSLVTSSGIPVQSTGGLAWSNAGPIGVIGEVHSTIKSYLERAFVGRSSVAKQLPEAANLQFYPNPASSFVQVRTPGSGEELELYDMLGRKVLTVESSPDAITEVDIRSLANGIYSVVSVSNGGRRSLGNCIISK